MPTKQSFTGNTTYSSQWRKCFANFMPGQRLQVDYAEKGNSNLLMIVDCISGFMQAYKTTRKSTEDAIKCLRDWASKWGMPYEVKSDNGSSFRKEWTEELMKLGVKIIHTSAYNSQSMGLVERLVRTLKEILHKNNNLSQLLLNEQIFGTARKDHTTQDSTEEVLDQDYQTAGSASSTGRRT